MSDQSQNPLGKLQVFIDIVRMRRGPEDLPFDRSLLIGTVIAYGLLNLVVTLLVPTPRVPALPLVLIEIMVTLVAVRALLQLAHRPERFVQTATATFGFQLVLAPAVLGVAWLSMTFGKDASWQLPVAMLQFAMAVWVLAVGSRILRSATDWPLAACVAATITARLLTYVIILLIFPQAVPVVQS